MKKIILVRHAKSDWNDISLKDHDRPLNGRGKADGPIMAKMAKSSLPKPDLIISSSAVRALKTAIYFHNEFKESCKDILIEKSLYHASEDEILEVLSWQEDDINTIYLFAHNPGLTYFASEVNTNEMIPNVATTGVLEIEYTGNNWADIRFADLYLKNYYYPKMFK